VVLVSLALVVAATVLLVLGLLGDGGLTLIVLSIGCSVASAMLLTTASRRRRSVSPG
jgi:hypothetical protein